MMEIDYALVDETDTPPEPARPILASHLLHLEEKQRRQFTEGGRSERLKSGCEDIDELLGGGFERGILAGISAGGIEGRLISIHLLASVLISCLSLNTSAIQQRPDLSSKAMIIDTTGSFPLSLLAKVLKSRITTVQALSARTANQTANYQLADQSTDFNAARKIDADVQRCLEMVAISRVFDVEGLWEVLGEIGRDTGKVHEGDVAVGSKGPSEGEEKHQDLYKTQEIVDSEEETSPSNEDASPASITRIEAETSRDHHTEIIIIDNLTHIINELFARKEKRDAHTLLTLLSQTLHTLSQSQNILTLLHNTVVSTKSTYNPAGDVAVSLDPQQENPPHHPKRPSQPPKLVAKSIFPSNTTKPSLGQIFAQFPSLHLFLSSLPKTREDADLLYSLDEDPVPLEVENVGYCTVLEVLKDETPILGPDREKGRNFGWREQRWTALEVTGDGTGLVGAFQVKGNMRGMGLDREKVGGLTDVGRVAKMHGFGGRRV